MARDCIPRSLSNLFYSYGKFVARHPLPFLLIPPVIAVALLAGIVNMESTSDAEYLYAPVGSSSKDERDYFEKNFPIDDYNFSPLRLIHNNGFLQIHIQDKDSRNVLNEDARQSIETINNFILSYEVSFKGNTYNFSGICTLNQGQCHYTNFPKIISDQQGNIGDMNITFPFHQLSTGETVYLISSIGDPKLDEHGIVQSARAVKLHYFVRSVDPDDWDRSIVWLDGIRDELLEYNDPYIEVTFQTSESLEQELETSVSSIIPLFAVAYCVLGLFSVLSCLMFDWVRAKPHVALSGLVASALGIISSMGVMSAAGVKFASVVGTMPFLIIGIGLDDMFILVSAWRYTSFKLSSEERMGETLRSAAVSITITSVTDALAFGIGCLVPFRSVTIYCAYTGVAVVFVYLYMITFTVACMVYSGRREESNRHPFFCQKVVPKEQAGEKSNAYKICCAGGLSKENNGTNEMKPQSNGSTALAATDDTSGDDALLSLGIQLPWLNRFLGTTFAKILLSVPVKIAVLLFYCGMISGAVYGVVFLEQGLDRANLAPDSSYFRDYYRNNVRDFTSNYGLVTNVAINEEIDWSRQSVRDDVYDLIREFRNNKYFVTDPKFLTFWLNDFERYLATTSGHNLSQISTMSDFIEELGMFLEEDAFHNFKADLIFNSDNTSIKASRFFVTSRALDTAVDEQKMMLDSRKIADDSKFDVEVFQPVFVFFDQYVIIVETTLQNLGIAVASMFVVSLILIPSITTAIWVTLTTVSICTCIIGYMSLWGVSLDSVSMINLVMCIGFSVDFAAHISYHFVTSPAIDPNDKARDALGYLGTPIVQGAVSTILAVVALSTSDTYIFRTFFKLVFLVMVFGFYHALFLLPVVLSTLNVDRCRKRPKRNEPQSMTQSSSFVHGGGKDNPVFYT